MLKSKYLSRLVLAASVVLSMSAADAVLARGGSSFSGGGRSVSISRPTISRPSPAPISKPAPAPAVAPTKSLGSSTSAPAQAPAKTWGSKSDQATTASTSPSNQLQGKTFGSKDGLTTSGGAIGSTPVPTVTGTRDQANLKTSSAPKMSAADQALMTKAKQNGTSFSTASAAKADFQSKYASKYNSSFATEPATRPPYIPKTYSTGGQNVTIIYDHSHGGYGYYDPYSHGWMAYNMMADMAMLDVAMHNNGYYYGQPVNYQQDDQTVTTVTKDSTDENGNQVTTTQKVVTHPNNAAAGKVFVWFLGILGAIIIIALLIKFLA